jgi:hypothetical protein
MLQLIVEYYGQKEISYMILSTKKERKLLWFTRIKRKTIGRKKTSIQMKKN